MNLSAWLQELKRRRVFRALAGYGLVAFALLQVAEPVMHGLGLPDWVLKVVVIGLGLGLPITILLAWAYDLKATGIERTPSAGPGRGWRTVALVAIGLALAAPGVTYYLVYRGRDAGPAGGPAAGGPSVAVLPFVNMSGDAENEYFSDGLSEEILNALAQVPGLRVPARTSSFAFKGKTLDVAKIAEALRVGTILEGSVRKAGGRVRITAQLVKAVDGYHLWSQTFDRELKDVFAVQDEISTAIAGALKLQLAPVAGGGARKSGSTSRPEAHEAYLKGRHELNERSRASIEKAMAHFEKAVALDPGFAVAYADLAVAATLLARGNYGEMPLSKAVERARKFLERAQALAPEDPQVLAAAGQVEQNAGHVELALKYLERSLAINPSNGEAHLWRKNALEGLGRYEQVLPAITDAVRADPLSRLTLSNYIEVLQRFGKDGEVGPAMERLRQVDEGWGQTSMALLALASGDRVEAVRHLIPAIQQGCEIGAGDLAGILGELDLVGEALRVARGDTLGVYLRRGDLAKAEAVALAAVQRTPGDLDARFDLLGVLAAAGRAVEAARLAVELDREIGMFGGDPAFLLLAATATRDGGHPAVASRFRDQAGQKLEHMVRAGMRPDLLDFHRARMAAYDGRDDEAVARLAAAFSATGFSWGRAELGFPLHARLLRRPDYQAALKRLDAILAAQRRQVVELLCGPQRLSATWQPAPETCAGRPGPGPASPAPPPGPR